MPKVTTTSEGVQQVGQTPTLSTVERVLNQVSASGKWLNHPDRAVQKQEHESRKQTIPWTTKHNDTVHQTDPGFRDELRAVQDPAYFYNFKTAGKIPEHAVAGAEALGNGSINAAQLYRSYKASPHAPASVFLKYLIHRSNNIDSYDTPEVAHQLDKDFLNLAQVGEASEKNGHVAISDLHNWTKKNAGVIPELLDHKAAVQQDILNGIGLNVRDIGGQPHVALTRGLNSDLMTKEHPASSWADIPATGFGSVMHHAWTPVSDVWFSYAHAHPFSAGEFGHENELVLSHTKPKYEATADDITPSRLKPIHKDVPSDMARRSMLAKVLSDKATDEDLAHGINERILGIDSDGDRILNHKNAGPLTLAAYRKITGRDMDTLGHKAVPREEAMNYVDHPNKEFASKALSNPNLTREDLENVAPVLPPERTYSILSHPAATSETAEAIWDNARRSKISNDSHLALAASHLTPPHILDEMVNRVVKEKDLDFYRRKDEADALIQNPNLTEEQTQKISDWSEANPMEGHGLPQVSPSFLLRHANPSPELVSRYLGANTSTSTRFQEYLKNPRASEKGLLVAVNHPEAQMHGFVARDKTMPLPASVQMAIINKIKPESKMNQLHGWQHDIAASRNLSQESIAAIATHPSAKLRDVLFHNKAVTPEKLEAVWPKGVQFPDQEKLAEIGNEDNLDRTPLDDLAFAIHSRRQYQERKTKEHIIKPFPKDLAKSEDSDLVWKTTLQSWISEQKNRDDGYLIHISGVKANEAMLDNRLDTTWTHEILDGKAVIALPATVTNLKLLQESLAPGDVVFRFKTDDEPKKLDAKRVYWTEPVKIEGGRVLDGSLNKDETLPDFSDGKLEDWEKEQAQRQLGHIPEVNKALNAARFLSGGKIEPDMERYTVALRIFGDVDRAALHAYKINDSKENLKALKAVLNLGGDDLSKSEGEPAPTIKSVEAVVPEAQDMAEAVQRAVRAKQVWPLHLNGKHSKGALALRDPKTGYVMLCKPGSGKLSPSAGIRQEDANQSRREACAWHVAELMGIGASLPHCDLLRVDGSDVAVMRLLGPQFVAIDKINAPKVLQPYLDNTLLHRWACFDWIVGSVDRHSQNIMSNGDTVVLIDEGSTFAGSAYSPGMDKNSFVPFYLRAWASKDFMKLKPSERIGHMPTLPKEKDEELRSWLEGIEPLKLEMVLKEYGIDPKATMTRLRVLKESHGSLSLAVDRLFAET